MGFCQLVPHVWRDRSDERSLIPVGCIDESKAADEPGPKGTVERMWSTYRGELRGGPVTASAAYSHSVRAAARDAVHVFLAHGVDSPDTAVAVRHLVARLGQQYGPQFLEDVAAKLLVELAEVTAVRCTTEDEHEGYHRPDPS